MKTWNTDNGPVSPNLKQLAGKCVLRAWVLPPGDSLFIRFEGGKVLMAEYRPPVNGLNAVGLAVGEEKSSNYFFLDANLPQTEYTLALRGRKLSGVTTNKARMPVLDFGGMG